MERLAKKTRTRRLTIAAIASARVLPHGYRFGGARRPDNGHTIQINSKTGGTLTVGDKTFALVMLAIAEFKSG